MTTRPIPPKPQDDGETPLGNIEAAIRAGERACEIARQVVTITVRMPDGNDCNLPLVLAEDGSVVVLERAMALVEEQCSRPHRCDGDTTHYDVASFASWVNRHKHPAQTALWADVLAFGVTAVINGPPPRSETEGQHAGWGDFRGAYLCPRSPAWRAWTEREGKAMSQDDFAQWLDEHLDDLGEAPEYPKRLDMVDMVRNLQIHTKGVYGRKINPTTGEVACVLTTEHGEQSTKIPRAFLLGLRVFDGGELYAVEARIQFRLDRGAASFAYQLHRRHEIEREAFDGVALHLGDLVGLPIFRGPAPRPHEG